MYTDLLSLPLEIRCQILSYLLVSPSKYVTTLPPGPWLFSIMPWDLRQEMTLESYTQARCLHLSLLRVCKQINQESKDLLWGQNTVVYTPFEVLRHNKQVSNGLGPIAFARRVALCMDMTTGGMNISNTASALDALGSWSKEGCLEEVTVVVLNERRKPFEERDPKVEHERGYKASLERLMKVRTGGRATDMQHHDPIGGYEAAKMCFVGHLNALREAKCSLPSLKRKIIVNTNFGRLSFREQRKYLQGSCMDANDLMKELNEAFGGVLCIDGKVCFEDGVRLKDAFETLQEDWDDDPTIVEQTNSSGPRHYQEVSGRKEAVSGPRHDPVAFHTWGQLLDEHASILDILE